MRKIIIASFGLICLLFCLTGCGQNQKNDIKAKLDSELEYEEDLIFKIANKHAKGEYFEDDKFKWEYVKGDVQKINQTWNALILDLTEVNVKNEELSEFGNELNGLIISFSKENESQLITKLSGLYKILIKFEESYSENENEIKKNKVKGDVLEIYSLVNNNDFVGAKTKCESAIENYKVLMNDKSYAEENVYNLKKIYVLLEEYKNAVATENYDLIRMKYILAVENL